MFYTPDDDVIYFNERYLIGELQVMFSELDATISTAEISKAINEHSKGKSAGPDRSINEFFIHGKTSLIPHFHLLFNKVFESSYFPSAWSEKLFLCTRRETSLMLTINAVLPF